MAELADGSTEYPHEISRDIEFWLGLGCAAVAAIALGAWSLSLDHWNQHRPLKSDELSDQETRHDQDARAALLDYYGPLLRSWSERGMALAVTLFSVVLARPYLTFEGFKISLSSVIAMAIFTVIRMVWHGALAEHVLHVPPLSQADLRSNPISNVLTRR